MVSSTAAIEDGSGSPMPTPARCGLAFPTLPTILRRYRAFAGLLPTRVMPEAGGFIEIVRFYLTRDLNADDPVSTDEIYVQQRVFWNLTAMYVQFGRQLIALGDIMAGSAADPFTGAIGQLVSDEIIQELVDAGYMGFWTC